MLTGPLLPGHGRLLPLSSPQNFFQCEFNPVDAACRVQRHGSIAGHCCQWMHIRRYKAVYRSGISEISLKYGGDSHGLCNAPVHLIVNGGNPTYTYVWSPLTGLTLDPTPPNATANPGVTTTYQLIASDQGCRDTVSVNVVRVTPIELSVQQHVIETCIQLFRFLQRPMCRTLSGSMPLAWYLVPTL